MSAPEETVGTVDVVTEGRRQKALLTAEALQSAIFNSANFSKIATDAKGVIQIFNVGAERMLGYTAADVMNKITPADISDPQEVIARAKALSVELGTRIAPGFEALAFKASRGIEDIYELTYIRKDGSRFPAVVSVTALRDTQDAIIGYLLIGTDNTARMQASQYARSLLEASLDPLVTISNEGKITDVNEATVTVTGVTREELIGSDFFHYFTEPEKARKGYQLVFEHGLVADYPLTIRHRDGRLTDVLYNATVYKDVSGNVLGVFAAARDVTDRKQASQYARSLLEASLDPLVTISPEGKITDVNEGSIKVTGVARQQLIGTDFSDYFTEPEKAREGYQQVFARGFVTDYPLTIRHKDGRLTDVLYNASVYKDVRGNVLGVFAAARDITDRMHAEAALLRAGALQTAIFNSANFSSIATDAKGVIQIFNVGAERMLGYTAADVMNKITPADISDPQEVIARAQELSAELDTPITPGFEALVFKASRGIEDIYELTYIRKDGSRFPAVVSVTALRDAQGAIIGYLLIGTDNTARKQVEEEQKNLDQRLRDQQFYTRSLIESNIDALMTTDPSGIITDVNKQMEALTGCTRDELIGAPFKSYFTDPERAEAAINLVLSEKKLTNYELTARTRDGKETVVSYNATTFYDRDRKLQGVFAAARDVTERKRLDHALEKAKEAAEDSNRAKSVFLSTMSHEIRTPMNGVLGMLELLSLTKLDDAQRTTLEVVRESGSSLQRIIDDILDFSKIEAGKLEVCPEAASIASALEAVRNMYSGNASSKRVLLKCAVDPRISPALMVDPMRLRQILNNLVSNALKFTSKGSIEIKAVLVNRSGGEDRVRFSVTDSGIGISTEDQARLFQPFVQAAGESGPRAGGTGLGLTICRRLAELMGGSIEMVSKLGTGTTMVLELLMPIADPLALAKAEPGDGLGTSTRLRRRAPEIDQARLEGTLVLLADDHPTNRSLLLRQVNMLGYAAESAENGVEALAMWKSGRFAILITDCNMPEMNGYELAQSIRESELAAGEGKRIPIVACTAIALEGEAETCVAAGMDDYLAKPVGLMDLAKKLDQWLPIMQAAVPVDRSMLAAICGGDAAAEREILADFQRVNEDDAASLKAAVKGCDADQVKHASHRIKGSSSAIGAVALAAVCERLESAGRAADWNSIQADMGAFQHELERLNTYCEEAKCTSAA